MRYSHSSKVKEEIKNRLEKLYSEPTYIYKQVLDFGKGYDFFSDNEISMVKYSSKWFTPDKYDHNALHEKFQNIYEDEDQSHILKVNYDEGIHRNSVKTPDFASKLERLGSTENQLTRDLEKLGKTPYHLGLEGEKFRVVAATLQKCNSPFVRRTFQFTSNGIVETPEARTDVDQGKLFPIINQTKKGATQKLVTIRRFRVIKKDNFTGEKNVFPQKVRVGDKSRFLTVRIRSKERKNLEENHTNKDLDVTPEVVRITSSTEEEDFDCSERTQSSPPQAEETDDGEEFVEKKESTPENKISFPEHNKVNSDTLEDKKEEDTNSNDTNESSSLDYVDFDKRFSTYPRVFPHFPSRHQQSRHNSSKKFISAKQLRDHAKTHHPHQRYTRSGGTVEDRIKTATSKFGRTRRVLNIAGLRSKYKML